MTGRKVDRIFERNDITSDYIVKRFGDFLGVDDLDTEYVDLAYERDSGYTGDYYECTNKESLFETYIYEISEDKEFMEWFTSLKPITTEMRKAILEEEIDVDFSKSYIIECAFDTIIENLLNEYNKY